MNIIPDPDPEFWLATISTSNPQIHRIAVRCWTVSSTRAHIRDNCVLIMAHVYFSSSMLYSSIQTNAYLILHKRYLMNLLKRGRELRLIWPWDTKDNFKDGNYRANSEPKLFDAEWLQQGYALNKHGMVIGYSWIETRFVMTDVWHFVSNGRLLRISSWIISF